MIRTLKSRALERFWSKDDSSALRPDWVRKIRLILDALDAASSPDDMNLPGLHFHRLRGDLNGAFSLRVSRNWRVTFLWDESDAIDVDLVDYHGD